MIGLAVDLGTAKRCKEIRTFFAQVAIAIVCWFIVVSGSALAQDDVAQATGAAIEYASRSVVQIETIGGLTPKGKTRSTAPFSGTVVSADGLIVTASYNLLHEPASIFVRLPKKDSKELERLAAKVVATDSSRNLTLLKIEAEDMKPVRFAAMEQLNVGQRVIAIGKSVSAVEPNVSLGVVSALGRIWSRATQTDAKISRLNYGGPLVTLSGEAIGILVPLSHSNSEVGAGDGWYDSGIGFAARVDPKSASFKKFLEGNSIRAGLAGVTFEGPDENADPATISFCLPTSPAGTAGLEVGDTIVEANGTKIVRQGQFKHVIGPLYEEEMLAVKVDREGTLLDFSIELAGEIDPYIEPELGILLRLGSEQPEIEYVFPDSPAFESLEVGDRIAKVNENEVASSEELRLALSQLVVDVPCRVEVIRNGEPQAFDLSPRRQIANLLLEIPDRITKGAGQVPFETIEISVAEGSNKCFAFVPKAGEKKDDSAPQKPALLVWVPPPGPFDSKVMFERMEDLCSADMIMLVPQSVDPEKWLPDDASVIAKALERLEQRVGFDRNRVGIAGKGPGGEMAMLTAFSNRSVFKGVAVVDAELTTSLPNIQSLPSARIHLLILGGDDDRDSVQFFRDKGFSLYEEPSGPKPIDKVADWTKLLDRL